MSESKLGSAPDGAGAAAMAAETDASDCVAGPAAGVEAAGVADADGAAGAVGAADAAGRSGIVGAVTRSAAEPTTDGVKVAPSLAHTSTPAGYCVRHRGQTDTSPV